MTTSIVIPAAADIGAYAPDVADDQVNEKGNYVPRLAQKLIDVATAASTDINTLQTGSAAIVTDLASVANGKGASLVAVEDPGGLYAALQLEALILEIKVLAPVRHVRGVVPTNIADLAAFTVAGNDGLTYTAGQRLLAPNQTTAPQCGVYVVGVVGGGTAALTRAADMPTGAAIVPGGIIEVAEGTEFAGSTWKAFATTGVIGTNDPVYYPRKYNKVVTLASGTYTIGVGSTATPDEALFLRSTTESDIQCTRDTAGGTIATTVMYVAPVASRIAGKAGTAAVEVRSAVAAGTILNTDTSTVNVLITNW